MSEQSSRPARVLVVDDDPEILSTLVAIARRFGHQTAAASDGLSALSRLRSEDFELVLLDVVLPEMDGLEVLRSVRKLRPELKILAMSAGGAFEGIDYLRLARDLGADYTLKKPFAARDLAQALEQLGFPVTI